MHKDTSRCSPSWVEFVSSMSLGTETEAMTCGDGALVAIPPIPASWATTGLVNDFETKGLGKDTDGSRWAEIIDLDLNFCKEHGAMYEKPKDEDSQLKEDLSKRDRKFAERLLELKEAPKISSTDPVIQKMMRELPADEKEDYKKKSSQEQEEFKKMWIQEQLEDKIEKRSTLKSYQKIDVKLGSYMSASKVWQEEGGSEEDFIPTQKLLRKKLLLGWPHVAYNAETERHDFLYIRRQNSEIFKQCWEAYTQGTVAEKPEKNIEKKIEKKTEKPEKPEKPEAQSNKRKANDKKPEKPEAQNPKRKKSNIPVAEDRAAEVMKKFNLCLVSSRQILQWIKEGKDEWGWANTEKTLAPFESKVKSLEDAVNNMTDSFEKNYLMNEEEELKKMDPVEKERQFTNLADKFEKLTKPCQDQLAWLKQNMVIRRQIGLS